MSLLGGIVHRDRPIGRSPPSFSRRWPPGCPGPGTRSPSPRGCRASSPARAARLPSARGRHRRRRSRPRQSRRAPRPYRPHRRLRGAGAPVRAGGLAGPSAASPRRVRGRALGSRGRTRSGSRRRPFRDASSSSTRRRRTGWPSPRGPARSSRCRAWRAAWTRRWSTTISISARCPRPPRSGRGSGDFPPATSSRSGGWLPHRRTLLGPRVSRAPYRAA